MRIYRNPLLLYILIGLNIQLNKFYKRFLILILQKERIPIMRSIL